jgi:hypothetical protein
VCLSIGGSRQIHAQPGMHEGGVAHTKDRELRVVLLHLSSCKHGAVPVALTNLSGQDQGQSLIYHLQYYTHTKSQDPISPDDIR